MENENELELELEEDAEETDWKAVAEKAQADAESWKSSALRYKKKATNKEPSAPAQDPNIDAKFERLELKTDGYTDEAIAFIQSNGGKEGLKNEYVAAAVKAIQEQKRAEAALVSDETAKSDVERKYSPAEIENMSVEQLREVLPKASK